MPVHCEVYQSISDRSHCNEKGELIPVWNSERRTEMVPKGRKKIFFDRSKNLPPIKITNYKEQRKWKKWSHLKRMNRKNNRATHSTLCRGSSGTCRLEKEVFPVNLKVIDENAFMFYLTSICFLDTNHVNPIFALTSLLTRVWFLWKYSGMSNFDVYSMNALKEMFTFNIKWKRSENVYLLVCKPEESLRLHKVSSWGASCL